MKNHQIFRRCLVYSSDIYRLDSLQETIPFLSVEQGICPLEPFHACKSHAPEMGVEIGFQQGAEDVCGKERPVHLMRQSMAIDASFGWSCVSVLPNIRTLKKYQYSPGVRSLTSSGCVVPNLAILSD
jgi:hypothetical protein